MRNEVAEVEIKSAKGQKAGAVGGSGETQLSLEKYNIKSDEQVYDLSNDPSEEETMEVLYKIKDKLMAGNKATPPQNYLIFFFFAGHGLLKDGGQALLYNEF